MSKQRHHRKHSWSMLWPARFVAKWEGFLPYAYLDTIAQPPVWTIGYGHTGAVVPGEHMTEAEARNQLAKDLHTAAAAVAEKVKHRLSARQRIALISFVFNLGPGELDGQLLEAINAGKMHEAGDLMLHYDHAGSVVVQGLLNRRRAERWLMQHPYAPRRNPHRPTPIR